MDIKLPTWQRREDLFIVPPAGWLLVSIAVLSVFLAGGRPLWAQGILTIGIALLWVRYTPTKLPSRRVVVVLALLAITPLAAYLPGSWLAMPTWREGLMEYKAITTSPFVTPQPWLTFQAYFLWLTGWLWLLGAAVRSGITTTAARWLACMRAGCWPSRFSPFSV